MIKERVKILLIEDDKFDVHVTKNLLKTGNINFELQVANNGSDALEFLNQRGDYRNSILPDLILLDINLPDMDGREILTRLMHDSRFSRIPTVVLTGQPMDENPIKRFNLYEHAYINKWLNMNDFLSFISALEDSNSAPLTKQ